ncbi:MAG: OmpH family outer membrane protein, partial [Thiobacillus sp.]
DKDGVTMSESERKNKERELSNLNRDLQRQAREFREDLNLRRNEELGQIQERARKVVQDIAKAEKFDLILDQAVYVDPKSDITDKVMKALGGR